MAQTKEGAIRHRKNMIRKFGSEKKWKDFMRSIGSKGGVNSPRSGGFEHQPADKMKIISKKGGTISRRGKKDV